MTEKLIELDSVSPEIVFSIPPRILEAINDFVWYGVKPGSFVSSVLSNDLIDAVVYADDISLQAIRPICKYVYNAVPSKCWGSREKVQDYIKSCEQQTARGVKS